MQARTIGSGPTCKRQTKDAGNGREDSTVLDMVNSEVVKPEHIGWPSF